MSASPFLRSLREHMLVRRYSLRTIKSYSYWIKSFIIFNGKVHPAELAGAEVEAFLNYLACERRVSGATQAIALNALAFLYNQYLEQPLGSIAQFRRAQPQRKLPVVLTRKEVAGLLNTLEGTPKLMVSMLYASGLRRMELLRLRVKDIDFDNLQLQIWQGKGASIVW